MEDDFINSAINILQPVLESGIVAAGAYVKGCGRDVLTAIDVQYGIKYAARNVTGKVTGSLFDDDEDDDDDDIETVDDVEDPFTRYTGTSDKLLLQMNHSVDTWDEWEPTNPTEVMLKRSIDEKFSSVFN